MSRKLQDSHFAFKCPMKWDDMDASANGRFCNRCRKEVFDLTNCSLDEVQALQKKHGVICGFIQVAAVAATFSTAACANRDSTTTPRDVSSPSDSKSGMAASNENGPGSGMSGGTILPLADTRPEARNNIP